MNCESCHPLLLDHLYGLLDDAEAAGVDAHLATCPACAAARAEAARVQGLFARAAKSTFPDTTFAPPVPTPAIPAAEPRAPAPRAGRGFRERVGAGVPWAVAAAVLLAVPGTVVPVLDVFARADAARRSAEAARAEADAAGRATADARAARDARLTDARVALAAAEQSRTALLGRWVEEQTAVAQAAAARKLAVDVFRPAALQPGAPNDFSLVVRDEREPWEARGTRLVAEVRASDAVLLSQPLDHEKRGHAHALRLPAGAWTRVKPDAELTLVVAQVDEKTQARTTVQEVRLAGPVFATLLVTDKPAYRPGERLFFRSLTLDRSTLRPPAEERALQYTLVAGPSPFGRHVGGSVAAGSTDLVRVGGGGRVEPVRAADGQPVRGVGCGEFVLPPDLPAGDYTLVLRELVRPGGPPPALTGPVGRTVKVRPGTPDGYAKQVGFAAASYSSGDEVEGWAELKFRDQPVAGADVAAVVEVDGAPLPGAEWAPRTDARGRAAVRFALPPDVLDGDVRLKVTFRAGGREEVVADRVPVVGRRLNVEFFPEGGDKLVAGVPCRVYVRALTPDGRPVDIRGAVTDGRETLAAVETLTDKDAPGANRGLAAFTFTPRAGVRTWLKLDSPTGVVAPILADVPVHTSEVAALGGAAATARHTGFALPDAQLDGVVLSAPEPVTAPGQPIPVHLYSVGQPRSLVVGAYVRGRLADTQKVFAEAGQLAEVKLMAGADPRGGVVRVTAFEEGGPDGADLTPVAERLVFRRPGQALNLSLAVTSTGGGAVNCAVSATDEANRPAAAVLWAAAVNTGVAPGPQDRALPTHFLLAGDTESPDALEYADFLLTDHPKARTALDLVLGTQGWRRFVDAPRPVPPAAGRGFAPPAVMKAPAPPGPPPVWAEPLAAREARKVAETYAPLYEAAVQAVTRARAGLDTAQEQARDPRAIRRAEAAEAVARAAAADEQARANAARGPVRQFRGAVWYGVVGFAALALLCGGVSVARPQTRLPLGVSTVGAVGLAVFLFVAAGWGDEARGGEVRATADAAPAAREVAAGAAPEVAPPPRPARNAARDGGPVAATTPVPPPAAPLNFPTVAGGPARAPGGGGFGGASGGGPEMRPKDAPPPPFPVLPPGPPGTAPRPDVKAGLAKGGAIPGVAGPAILPDPTRGGPGGPPASAAPAAPGGPGGWTPGRFDRVTLVDLARNRPSEFHFRQTGDPAGAAEADALRRATADAARFAHDRHRALLEGLGPARPAADRPAPEKAEEPGRPRMHLAAPNLGGYTPKPDRSGGTDAEARALQQIRGAVTPLPPLVVREYARPRPSPMPLPDAPDAPDTVLWQPVIVLPQDGKAVLTFAPGDAPGGYRLVVAGHTADGRLGQASTIVLGAPGGSVPRGVPAAPGPRP